ncbi:heavy-metal-associated domain-containing protein [Trinickia mobilis]|uniref:heavy-metal-associated domain-containing protein n=1 Tax=Trinickia mobilis TaxID=2816356 RepID=UPI001A8DAC99|nr:cation transporter [Trinickia mobilis]
MIEFQVEGMSCQHCAAAVTKAIQAHDAAARVQVDLEQGRVAVESVQNASVLRAAIDEAGYTVKGAVAGAANHAGGNV